RPANDGAGAAQRAYTEASARATTPADNEPDRHRPGSDHPPGDDLPDHHRPGNDTPADDTPIDVPPGDAQGDDHPPVGEQPPDVAPPGDDPPDDHLPVGDPPGGDPSGGDPPVILRPASTTLADRARDIPPVGTNTRSPDLLVTHGDTRFSITLAA
ncbi:MAG TPA: hypothetical protein VFY82_09205, partial [Acidimicrobiales bacterium]|nr:hypothetical protein [Acidimicrobiales bacterium]